MYDPNFRDLEIVIKKDNRKINNTQSNQYQREQQKSILKTIFISLLRKIISYHVFLHHPSPFFPLLQLPDFKKIILSTLRQSKSS